ncbi:MAG: hypothetical protein IJY65_05600 [Clostridia bacterium]|nr:hypothetical protein [Clostridia bacterium]
MITIDEIKSAIKHLYETNPNIRVNIRFTRPKIVLDGVRAVIKAVYPNIFIIEECEGGYPRSHSVQYTDVLTRQVEILEI